MNPDPEIARLLGAAFLFVFVASFVSERLLATVVGSGSGAEILANIAENVPRVRLSNLVALLNSAGIVVLAGLLYFVFGKEYGIVALLVLGLRLAEAVTLAVGKIGTCSLIPLSQEYAATGAPTPSHLQTLGTFLYDGLYRVGYEIHMLFFCLGGILWCYLLHDSGALPRTLSLWGWSLSLCCSCRR